MSWLAETTMLSFGWRRALLLLIAGLIASLSMPPLFFLLALFVAMPIWVWALDGAEKETGLKTIFGAAFKIGFFFGLGYFLASLHWIGAAFFVDGGIWLFLMPFALLAIASFLALFWGFASALAHFFWSDGFLRIFALAFAISLFEFLRGWLFTGFPFDLLGYALTANDVMAQSASIFGIYGLTFIAAFLSLMPALIWPKDERSLTLRLIPVFLIIGGLTAQITYGTIRLDRVILEEREDIKLRLIQPNIKQSQKWQAAESDFIMEKLMNLSMSKNSPTDAGLNAITYLIWPEAAIPFYLSDKPQYISKIANMLPLGKFLITGAPRRETLSENSKEAYNSILMFNSKGEIISSYDKTHLVPFGEYLPFKNIFEIFGLKQFVPGNEGFKAGKNRKIMSANGIAPFLPLICYEVIFSGNLGKEIKKADFILNLTNDAWFDNSIGLAQNFHHAKIRAVEEGRSLVRVANSGISALVDPLGRVRAKLDEGKVGILDISPPYPLKNTIFSQYKNKPFFVVLFLVFLILISQKIFNKRNKKI